jgi:hypothetical protein
MLQFLIAFISYLYLLLTALPVCLCIYAGTLVLHLVAQLSMYQSVRVLYHYVFIVLHSECYCHLYVLEQCCGFDSFLSNMYI